MHKMENMGNVELATVAFGQSFQITPIQLATTVSSLLNGGTVSYTHLDVYKRQVLSLRISGFQGAGIYRR